MSEAFRCDGCREFFSGKPAFVGKAQGEPYRHDMDSSIRLKHYGGVDDYNPKGQQSVDVNWPESLVERSEFVLCIECFVYGVLPSVHDTIHDKEETK